MASSPRRSSTKAAIGGIKPSPQPMPKPVTTKPAAKTKSTSPKRSARGFAGAAAAAAPPMPGVPAASVGRTVQSFIDDGATGITVTSEGGGTFTIQPS